MRILIVDDNINHLNLLRINLSNSKNHIDIESNPLNVITLLENSNYDLIISDYQMPGMNGMELLKKIRKSKNKTNVILQSSIFDNNLKIEAIENGAIGYYLKPAYKKIKQYLISMQNNPLH